MQLDGRSVAAGAVLQSDVCIVGAGAAGISLALELAKTPLTTVLLESGGYQPDAATQALYRGRVEGDPYTPLDVSRLRYFGGTTNHWTGWCRRLDPIDLAARQDLPLSGWPIDPRDLSPYYERARPLLQLGAPPPEATNPFEKGAGLDVRPVEFSAPTRFGVVYRRQIEASPRIQLVLHANAVRLQREREREQVSHVRVKTLEGNAFDVRARLFVVACGGIENARLLLASNDVERDGLGNRNGMLGRCYMDHVAGQGTGWWLLPDASAPDREFSKRGDRLCLVTLSETTLTRDSSVAFSCRLADRRASAMPLAAGVAALVEASRASSGRPQPAHLRPLAPIVEQPPEPGNRIVLGEEKDALGMPQVKLQWHVSERALAALHLGLEQLAHAAGAAGEGRVRIGRRPAPDAKALVHGTHHMGATRMAADAKRGVVDADCRVHGLGNLYVAGSSVFATCGTQNPTYTIVALALRLADHIRQVAA